MNLSSGKPRAFDQEAIEQAVAVTEDASAAIPLAVRSWPANSTWAGQLRTALVSRAVIDHEIGIIIGQNRCTAQAVFEALSTASQHRNAKLRNLAAQLVAESSSWPRQHRARADPRAHPAVTVHPSAGMARAGLGSNPSSTS